MKKWILYAQKILCAVAMFMAVSSIDSMCLGRYYQPEVSSELIK